MEPPIGVIDQLITTQHVCAHCGAVECESGYEYPLCSKCRTAAAKRPFPTWLTASALILAIVLIFAAFRSVTSFRAGIAAERAERAENQKQYSLAADYYQQVVDLYPNSTFGLTRLAITRYQAGQLDAAAEAIKKLGTRSMKKETVIELSRILDAIKEKKVKTVEENH